MKDTISYLVMFITMQRVMVQLPQPPKSLFKQTKTITFNDVKQWLNQILRSN